MVNLASILALIGNRPVFTCHIDGAPGELRVVRFTSSEGVSSLFEFRVELACDRLIVVHDLIGSPATMCIEGIDEPRLVHAMVARAEYIGESRGFALCEVVLVPRVWRLTHRQDCRIFQDTRTADIIRAVLEGAGIKSSGYRFDLMRTYEPRNYCVQYRETDWDFVTRLLEEDGIFYYFEHTEEQHILVMADHRGTHRPIAGDAEVWWNPPNEGVEGREHIHDFRFGEEIRPGAASLRDFYFPVPAQPTEVNEKAERNPDLEVYDYPGEYRDPRGAGPDRGETIVKTRLAALQATRRAGGGTGDCMRLIPGYTFQLAGHPRSELSNDYMLLTVRQRGNQPQVLDQDAAGEYAYESRFTCIEATVDYRPPRSTPRPFVRGLQSATVVGPPGEEVHTDEQGRVMVQFHWDRVGGHNERSSCWIRVSQLWAGPGWGAMFLPRIGHEVLVDFLEGDPDKPIVTGRVYHGDNIPPYPLPAEKTKSTIKSDSSLGGGGYNELRFEDRKGAEQVFMHAERNLDIHVKNDRMENVLHDRHLTVGARLDGGKVGDFNEAVSRDHHARIDRHEHMHIGGDTYLRIGGIDGDGHEHVIVEANRYELVKGDENHHVIGDLKAQVNRTTSLTVGEAAHMKVNSVTAIESGERIHVRSKVIVIEAGEGITIKGPGGFVTIDASGVVIQGRLVRVNSGGSAIAGGAAEPVVPEDPKQAAPQAPRAADSGWE